MKTEVNMKKKKIKSIGYPIGLILLLAYPWISNYHLGCNNDELAGAVANQSKELAGKDQRIADLTSANKTLDALVRQQNKLIEGESLGEFMEIYESNEKALSVEILVHLEDSESGLPRSFFIEGCGTQKEEEL